MITILRFLSGLFLVFIMIVIVIVNLRIHYHPAPDEIAKELRGLQAALHKNADLEMQNIYPEGFVFMNAMYAMAWSSVPSEQAYAEVQFAWTKIDSEVGRAPFGTNFSSFYNGWSSYVLGRMLKLQKERDDQDIEQFRLRCDQIAEALQQTTYPPSYVGAAWPADVAVGVASLSMHDTLFEPRYADVVKKWVGEVKATLDGRGMIPHSVDGTARGSSMALMLIFLRSIDQDFAQQQFALFKENFVDTRFGLTGIREYPKGDFGIGDVDSGPVILGFGGAATIVGMQTLSLFGEEELALKVRNAVEGLAFPFESNDQKRYFLGILPMADAFIAWSHSGTVPTQINVGFMEFHLYSCAVLVILAIIVHKAGIFSIGRRTIFR